VLDLIGPREPKLAGLVAPVLGELHPELDFARKTRATGRFNVDQLKPVQEGTFTDQIRPQEIHFAAPAAGRYLCLDALNAFDGKSLASVAELEAVDPSGQLVPRTNWKLLWVDSEETEREGENALDGQSSSQWDSAHSGATYPHEMVIDLGERIAIGGIRYLPSSDTKNPGRIKDFRVYVSDQPFGLVPSQ